MISLFIIFLLITIPMSIYLLYYWRHLKKFIFINILIAVFYLSTIFFWRDFIWEKDTFGILTIFRLMFFILLHSLFILIFALYKRYNIDEKHT